MSHPRLAACRQFVLLSLFLLVFTGRSLAADCSLPLFGAPWHFSNGTTTVRTAIADFNNDGNLDIAATAHDSSFVGIFIGDGTGNFVRQTVLSAGNFSVPVAAGDFNNDGKQDLAVGSRDGTVWIYLGNGNGNFTSPVTYADGPGEAYEMAVADFNQDGKLDLAIGHQFAGLAIMIGDGAGGFTLSNTYLSGLGPVLVKKADFNNDGKMDLVTTNAQGGNDSILLGDGTGGFSVSTAPFSNYGFGLGDFNEDGNIDVVVTHSDGVSVLLYLGDGHGGFSGGTRFYSAFSYGATAADFNGDGHLDIAASNGTVNQMTVIFGDGMGHFGSPTTFSAAGGPGDPTVGDFNNDGRPDLVAPNYYGGDITVWMNNGVNTQDTSSPVISSAPNIITYATAPGGANVSYQIVAFDNSGQAPTFDCNIPPDSFFPIGTTNVRCQAVDACGNRSSNVSFNVSVTCGPIDLSPLGNIEVNATSATGAVINYGDVSGVASVSFSISNGSTFPIGTTNVNYVVTELCGNTIPGTFQVHVIDSPPELILPSDIHTAATIGSTRIVTYTAVATDAVSGNLPITCSPTSGSAFPVGQTIVNCSATDAAGQTATGSFNVEVISCPGCLIPTFGSARNFDVGSIPGRIAIADFNQDGKPDMAVTSPDSSYVAVFLGDGSGNFQTPTILPAGFFSVPVSTGDFNQDGKPDLAVGNGEGTVWVYLGNGAGGFSSAIVSPASGGYTYEIAVSDFNRDGKSDLALANQFGSLSVMLGIGGGAFASPVDYAVGTDPTGVSAVDLNSDGNIDLVTSNANSADISVLLGNGSGAFSPAVNYSVGNYPIGFGVGDFNGDNKIDLAVTNFLDNTVSVLLGNGAGGLSPATVYPAGEYPNGVRASDINGDGKLDLVIPNAYAATDSVLIGNGSGGFSAPFVFPAGNGIVGVTIADFNLDGKPDIATPNYFDNNVSILLNTTYQTQVGSGSTLVLGNTSFTFDNVTTGGTTSVTPIDPASVGEVPGGFAVSNSVAYEIATTATFTGSVTLAFKVPGPISEADFNNLAILHNVNGTLVDVTASTPARNYANLTIYATTASFSPFYLARRGPHIKSLFDQTKAYKSGSTIPVKFQLQNASSANVSSANTSLVARDLRIISNNTTAPVIDSGNANPDYTFRYDATLGAAGGGYIYNLSTKGLRSGQYVLSFYAGTDHSFFYTIKFEVK